MATAAQRGICMLGGTRFNGIYARDEAFTALLRGQPSCRERQGRKGPESHLTRPLRKGETEQPALTAPVRNAEVQPTFITMVTGLPEVLHPKRCEPMGRPTCL